MINGRRKIGDYMKHLITLKDIRKDEIDELLDIACKIKKNPEDYACSMENKTMLMFFEKPSLRTRVSFEVGMTQLGGHAIYYDIGSSPMGKGESIEDTAKTISRYCDVVVARLFCHETIEKIAENSSIPVINALTDFSHPCQILSDLLTIREKKGECLKGLKIAFLGDGNNNVTHSLIYGCSAVGMNLTVACPKDAMPLEKVVGKGVKITNDAAEAAKDADIIYTDSWMSYHVPKGLENERIKMFEPYRVNEEIMNLAKPDAIFMNCLPARRGYEQTAGVIDGPKSVVFDQAENRVHMQKAIVLKLADKANREV